MFRYDTLIHSSATVGEAYETEKSHGMLVSWSRVGGRMRILAHGDTGNAQESG